MKNAVDRLVIAARAVIDANDNRFGEIEEWSIGIVGAIDGLDAAIVEYEQVNRGERIISVDLRPGMTLRHKDGAVVILSRRKRWSDDSRGLPFHPGWWLCGGAGGLSDSIIEDTDDWAVSSENPEAE